MSYRYLYTILVLCLLTNIYSDDKPSKEIPQLQGIIYAWQNPQKSTALISNRSYSFPESKSDDKKIAKKIELSEVVYIDKNQNEYTILWDQKPVSGDKIHYTAEKDSTSLHEVVDQIAKSSGLKVFNVPKAKAISLLRMQKVTPRDALNAVATAHNYQVVALQEKSFALLQNESHAEELREVIKKGNVYKKAGVSLRLQNARVWDVLFSLSKLAEVNLIATDDLAEQRISLEIDNVTPRAALQIVTYLSHGNPIFLQENLLWAATEDKQFSSNTFEKMLRIDDDRPSTVRMEFHGSQTRDVIDQIMILANQNSIVRDKLKSTINVRFADLPWHTALKAIVAVHNLKIKQLAGNVYLIVDK